VALQRKEEYSMKLSATKKSKAMALVLVSGALVMSMSSAVTAEDIELDFRFLEVGMKRKAVVAILGLPKAETESQTLFVKYRRLTWLGQDGRKYSASFVSDRLFRWKICAGSVGSC
jgi:hypothetical protein